MNSFRMPAEWEQHARTWVIWPCRDVIWEGQVALAKQSYEDVIRAVARYEPVCVIVKPALLEEVSARLVDVASNVSIFVKEVDDSWARDVMPFFAINKDGSLRAIEWQFNAWGEKFSPYTYDQEISQHVIQHLKSNSDISTSTSIDMILEGGSVHFDGEGTVLTTKQCLLNKNRNPHLSQSDIESVLKKHFSVECVVWLEDGLFGDVDTDGHVDVIAAFASPGTIITMSTDDVAHPNYAIYAKNKDILENTLDARGRPFKIVEIPQPTTQVWNDAPLPLSYVNFYITNGAVIVPVFDDENDELALTVFRRTFPNHDIVPVYALPIFRGGGGIHCITMQQPALTKQLEE
ncbi:agmatine deiminase family protein [Marinomonas sp. 2405UD68-3]|uniref:agmatine deiminase family protein n=1 Tax=Marinomonas sp. 2405UD68-3 TaxID=3391835 RepID=UPI0039C902EE